MKNLKTKEILFSTGNSTLAKLHEIVQRALEEEKALTFELVNQDDSKDRTFGQRIADAVAAFGGSWKFIISFAVIIFCWILINTLLLLNQPFDPYPFILLNLILSCLAALQAPVIIMSQNRQEIRDRKRAENDYMINLKAELEIRSLHEKIDLLMEDQIQQILTLQQDQSLLIKSLQDQLKKFDKK